MRRDKWQPSATSVICSIHFSDDCFRKYHSQVRIKEDAVPTIFSFPQHLQKKVTVNRRPLNRPVAQAAVSPSNAFSVNSGQSSVEGAESQLVTAQSIAAVHNYACQTSPRCLKRKFDTLLEQQRRQQDIMRKRLKVVRQRLFRQQKKMTTMAEVIKNLKSRPDLNSTCIDMIERCFGHIPAEMLKRKLTNNSKKPYSDDLRSFALTLHFYSPKAYDFVRSSFSQSLPHPSTLRQWCSAVEGKPGFTSEAFEVGY